MFNVDTNMCNMEPTIQREGENNMKMVNEENIKNDTTRKKNNNK